LPRLAKAYHWTGDERYAAEAVAQLESWVNQNPPGFGINWQSSLEIGIRTISWLWTIFLLLGSKSFTPAAAQRIGNSLFAQLAHVHRYTSLFSSPNTHLIGEAAALFIGGHLFQDNQRAVLWMETGARLLSQEASRQILKDGAYGELSAYYHCYALDFYLQALALAQQNDFEFSEPVHAKVCGMLNFLMHLRMPSGAIPLIGDDDGGRALVLEQRTYSSYNDALCSGAVLFERSDFKHQSDEFFEETFWLLGRRSSEAYTLLRSTPPAGSRAVFPNAGYAMQRSGWDIEDSHLVFDIGGLGLFTGGHSHADALSVVLSSGGRELLVDPGTFVYNCAPEWRAHFRSTRAHNTVTIDGCDQAQAGGTFRWKTKILTRTNHDASFPAEYIEAEHDGYERLNGGVIHRRRILYIPGEYWILVDDFRGSGRHTFDFNYHFGAEVDATLRRPSKTGVEISAEDAGLFLSIYTSRAIGAQLVRGETKPIAGWISRGYGNRAPARTLRATITGRPGDSAAMTFLAPRVATPAIERLHLNTGSAIACAYRHFGYRDIAVYSTGRSEVEVAGLRLRGEFFWLRMEGQIVRKAVAIRGRWQRGKNFLEEPVCAPSAAS
jgi:hypothetical protein